MLQHWSWHSSRQSLRSLAGPLWPYVEEQAGTQSFRQPRYFGSFFVPSGLSLLVGRMGSLRPLVQTFAAESAACADGANRDAAAHAATSGNTCRLLHLGLESAGMAGARVGESRADEARSGSRTSIGGGRTPREMFETLRLCKQRKLSASCV